MKQERIFMASLYFDEVTAFATWNDYFEIVDLRQKVAATENWQDMSNMPPQQQQLRPKQKPKIKE